MEINATLLVQIVLFLLLLAWLSRFLFAPLLRLFDERERRIEGAREEAARLSQNAHEKLAQVEERIRLAQKEARQVLAELKAEGAEYQRRILDAAKQEARQKSEQAQAQLVVEVQRVKTELRHQVGSLSELVLSQFLGSEQPSGASKSGLGKVEVRGV
jgi:F-type H+-transporting ATPase subunit b